ncbi:MAG TPA: rhodanese-like domain-containing protein [Burkholderiaceae bacterium]|jgi:rhodanese-related sulfurtransferase|uniref:rhodanese-like domain-containing protein n=1 Tax=Candidatus Skiveiella danica TaxID=3386177 RepID=UPI001B7599BE|nr:rhodanese-like domain-containing protein [Comamonadaceae bacterium]MBP7966502.1 rhodanese-like domain-containing protein [Burkholderiaceae bacterium]MBK7117684.1 rhodanese-like domain-containing protein [Comamonadaceae bacterium]MBK7506699.1 rhodanese-like domain-containing protein [Comamonadaceae bacterium]MBK8359774.1 rhodanese-like domain-containing protein [Comamonadaceae bacterium]
MKTRHLPLVAALLSAFALAQVQAQTATPAAAPASAAAVAYSPANPGPGWYKHLVNLDFVKKQAAIPKIDGVMLIDSRPTARKYDIGHIPTAVNIPDTSFDKLAPTMLPKDKAMLLVFYCEGYDCILSHSSAAKAEALGYTNVRVFAEGFPGWVAGGNLPAVSVAYIKKLIDEKAPMTLIDARPKARKYDLGYIPTAINIPDSQFDSLAPKMLPADKAAPLYFYCDGLACVLSNDSALKAVKLGYTNVKVVPEGYPAWVKAYGPGPTAAAGAAPAAAKAPAIEAGKEAGSIAVASFERIFKEAPDSVFLIDVRDPKEFDNGTFKGAINMPLSTLEKNLDKLPTGKPIIFFCGAGARSGEAHDLVKLHKPEMKTVFLDADIKWTKDGAYTIKGK